MSRHRNVRSMRYSDEYDGYDDVYGHSVEEDYSISPSDAAFMYDRSTQQRQISSLLSTEENIAEEDEIINEEKTEISNLNDIDKAKLMSCLDEIRNVLGDSIPEQILLETIINSNYDITIALDKLLNRSIASQKKERESPKPQRTTPLRRFERGGRIPNKLASHKMNDENQDLLEANRLESVHVFDVKEFLSSNNNQDTELELSKAMLNKHIKNEKQSHFKTEKAEKMSLCAVEVVDIVDCNGNKEQAYELQSMSINELQKVKPSRLGFFVCKCLAEVNSSYPSILKRSDLSNINIIPFKFDCLSPDEEVLSKRKW